MLKMYCCGFPVVLLKQLNSPCWVEDINCHTTCFYLKPPNCTCTYIKQGFTRGVWTWTQFGFPPP